MNTKSIVAMVMEEGEAGSVHGVKTVRIRVEKLGNGAFW